VYLNLHNTLQNHSSAKTSIIVQLIYFKVIEVPVVPYYKSNAARSLTAVKLSHESFLVHSQSIWPGVLALLFISNDAIHVLIRIDGHQVNIFPRQVPEKLQPTNMNTEILFVIDSLTMMSMYLDKQYPRFSKDHNRAPIVCPAACEDIGGGKLAYLKSRHLLSFNHLPLFFADSSFDTIEPWSILLASHLCPMFRKWPSGYVPTDPSTV